MAERAELIYSTETVKTHFCPIYSTLVTKDQCLQKTCVVRLNEQYCTGDRCESPWRLCLSCVLQGYKGLDAQPDPQSGLCKFHKTNGKDARRADVTKSDHYINPVFPLIRGAAEKSTVALNKEDAMSASAKVTKPANGKAPRSFGPEEGEFIQNWMRDNNSSGTRTYWDELVKAHRKKFGFERPILAIQQWWYRNRKNSQSSPDGKSSLSKTPPVEHPEHNGKPSGSTWECIEEAIRHASEELEIHLQEQADLAKKIEALRRTKTQLEKMLDAKS